MFPDIPAFAIAAFGVFCAIVASMVSLTLAGLLALFGLGAWAGWVVGVSMLAAFAWGCFVAWRGSREK